MARPRVLFLTDRGERHQQSALAAAPPELEVIMRRRPSEAELATLLPSIDFLISERNQPITEAMIQRAKNLKMIVRLGSLDHDIAYGPALVAGIHVVVQPVMGTIYCAEHALMMMLAVVKRLGRSLNAAVSAPPSFGPQRTDEDTFAFNWRAFSDIGALTEKTVAILGMGEIGVELARLLRGFRLAGILYNKRTPYPDEVAYPLNVHYADWRECLRRADVLVSLLPYSVETDFRNGGLNAGALAQMKRGAHLVHLGSGSVLDEQALIKALQDGRLAGAALDTYEYEPLPLDHPLAQYARQPDSNLLLTPHTAAASAPGNRADDYAAILNYLRGGDEAVMSSD
ncbi:MAG: hypothetical protein IT323_00165 [Anaerolineae bacterium]|nr:hypothetical protein [Anaerolineae bacterium]